MKKRSGKFISTLLFVCSLLCVFKTQLFAFHFNFESQAGITYKYKHWNSKRNKITGFTNISYNYVDRNDKKYLIEKSNNTNSAGVVFSEKVVWFKQKTGKWIFSEEKDYRSNTTVFTERTGNQIKTQIKEKDQIRHLTIDEENGLISFELLTLYLQKNISALAKKSSINFVLFIPHMALELEKKGLPLSWSKLNMIASVEKHELFETVFGKQPAIWIVVKPSSFLITSLLPKGKTEFRFIFQEQKPHLLLMFVENKTESILVKIVEAKKR